MSQLPVSPPILGELPGKDTRAVRKRSRTSSSTRPRTRAQTRASLPFVANKRNPNSATYARPAPSTTKVAPNLELDGRNGVFGGQHPAQAQRDTSTIVSHPRRPDLATTADDHATQVGGSTPVSGGKTHPSRNAGGSDSARGTVDHRHRSDYTRMREAARGARDSDSSWSSADGNNMPEFSDSIDYSDSSTSDDSSPDRAERRKERAARRNDRFGEKPPVRVRAARLDARGNNLDHVPTPNVDAIGFTQRHLLLGRREDLSRRLGAAAPRSVRVRAFSTEAEARAAFTEGDQSEIRRIRSHLDSAGGRSDNPIDLTADSDSDSATGPPVIDLCTSSSD